MAEAVSQTSVCQAAESTPTSGSRWTEIDFPFAPLSGLCLSPRSAVPKGGGGELSFVCLCVLSSHRWCV